MTLQEQIQAARSNPSELRRLLESKNREMSIAGIAPSARDEFLQKLVREATTAVTSGNLVVGKAASDITGSNLEAFRQSAAGILADIAAQNAQNKK